MCSDGSKEWDLHNVYHLWSRLSLSRRFPKNQISTYSDADAALEQHIAAMRCASLH